MIGFLITIGIVALVVRASVRLQRPDVAAKWKQRMAPLRSVAHHLATDVRAVVTDYKLWRRNR